MVLTIDCQDSVFTLEEPSDSIFLDTLGAGKTKTVTFKYHTDLETEEGHYRIHLSMTYDDSNAMTYSSSGQITVNVKQESKVELVAPRIESEYTAGDTIPLAFQVLNLGRNKIYNVRCEAKGYGMLPVNTAYIGDMEAGTEGNATLNLFITQKTKSPDYQGTEPYGLTEGTLTLIYEDADGKEYTDERPFTSSILAQVYSVTTDTDAPKGKSALLWWIAILAGGLLLTAMLLSFFYYKRKKAKN